MAKQVLYTNGMEYCQGIKKINEYDEYRGAWKDLGQ